MRSWAQNCCSVILTVGSIASAELELIGVWQWRGSSCSALVRSTQADSGGKAPVSSTHTYFSTLFLKESEQATWTALQGLMLQKDSNASGQQNPLTSETGNGNCFASSYMTSADFFLTFLGSSVESFELLWLCCCYKGHSLECKNQWGQQYVSRNADWKPTKTVFILHQKHKHFCGWQEKHTSVVSCGVSALCHSGKGTISKSRKDAQSSETSLIKPVKKLLWRSAERTGGHCFSCWQEWGWTTAFHVWKMIRKLRLRFDNLLIMRKIKRAFVISTLTGLQGKWDLKKNCFESQALDRTNTLLGTNLIRRVPLKGSHDI